METDYILPGCLFSNLPDLFLNCECGASPVLLIKFDNSGELIYEAECPQCGRTVTCFNPDDRFDLDFYGLAEDWNSRISED